MTVRQASESRTFIIPEETVRALCGLPGIHQPADSQYDWYMQWVGCTGYQTLAPDAGISVRFERKQKRKDDA